jgi:hypothetical protein
MSQVIVEEIADQKKFQLVRTADQYFIEEVSRSINIAGEPLVMRLQTLPREKWSLEEAIKQFDSAVEYYLSPERSTVSVLNNDVQDVFDAAAGKRFFASYP